jgi:hypothetical protein
MNLGCSLELKPVDHSGRLDVRRGKERTQRKWLWLGPPGGYRCHLLRWEIFKTERDWHGNVKVLVIKSTVLPG